MTDLPRPWEPSSYYWPEIEDGHWPFSIAERYLQNRGWLHLHLRLRAGLDGDVQHPRDLCGVIVAASEGPTLVGDDTAIGRLRNTHTYGGESDAWGDVHREWPTQNDRDAANCIVGELDGDAGESRMQVPMFVHVVQVIQESQGVPSREVVRQPPTGIRRFALDVWMPSRLVRLSLLDECEIFRKYAGRLPSRLGDIRLPLAIGFVFVDREFGSGSIWNPHSRTDAGPCHDPC